MLKVHVWFHKDGDHLAIVKVPWWLDSYEWLVNHLFCPCCGYRGWLAGKSERIEVFFYTIWNYFLTNVPLKFEKQLYKVRVENGCEVHRAIFNTKSTCWNDDCQVCWAEKEDAYTWKE